MNVGLKSGPRDLITLVSRVVSCWTVGVVKRSGAWRIVLLLVWCCVRATVRSLSPGPGRAACGLAWLPGRGSSCWRPRACQTPRSPSAWGLAPDGGDLAGPLPGQGPGGAGRRPAPGTAPPGRPRQGGGRYTDPTPEVVGDHALVDPPAGTPPGGLARHGGPGLAGLRDPALAGAVLPVLHRPRVRRQGHRRLRALPEHERGRPGQRDRAQRGREVPDPGPGPDGSGPAHAARADRAPLPRLPPARHHHPVRRPGGRHRPGHCGAQAQAPPPGAPRLPAPGRAGPPRRRRRAGPPRRAAPDHGRLRHPQAQGRTCLAGGQPTLPRPLHPTHASWTNLVEVWFSLLERQALRRSVSRSVKDLNHTIRTYVNAWNKRAHPFIWTRTAQQVLTKANRPTTSSTRH